LFFSIAIVLACQAIQAYYLPYASTKGDRKNWWVAMKTQRKRKLGVEFFQEEQFEGPILPTILNELQETESDTYNNNSLINYELDIEQEDDDSYAHISSDEGNIMKFYN
jgi:hypothetical protein